MCFAKGKHLGNVKADLVAVDKSAGRLKKLWKQRRPLPKQSLHMSTTKYTKNALNELIQK